MMGMMGNPMMGMMNPTINLNKIYDIRVGGPADTHQKLNMIYEDILPTKHIKNSFVTLSDRITQSNYIRSVLFPNGDGDDVGFSENSKNNLLSHIKFLDLNPYNTYNPYTSTNTILTFYLCSIKQFFLSWNNYHDTIVYFNFIC